MSERETIDGLLADARRRIERLPPEAALRAMADGALLVDTRGGDDRRATGAIPGSVHVPLSVLFRRLDPSSGYDDPALSDLERPVILICAHGYSSSVADVIGGFEAWSAAGLPVVPQGS